MKLLCDENIDKSTVKYLRSNGFDVSFIREICRGMKDIDIIQKAFIEERIIITKDKDFGEFIFHYRSKCYGVILLRMKEGLNYNEYLLKILNEYKEKIKNNLIVLSFNSVRIRKY